MDPKIAFDATPYGRAFLHVVRVLQDDLAYRGHVDKVWIASLALFAQVKGDHDHPGVPAQKFTELRPAEYWDRISLLSSMETEASMRIKLTAPERPGTHDEVLHTVTELILIHGSKNWDFSDSAWFLPRSSYSMALAMSPEVADLMVDIFGDVRGKYVWCLLDASYQLACRFAKKGANVVTTIDNSFFQDAIALLNRLHGTSIRSFNPLATVDANSNSAPYDIGVAVPPFGMRDLPRTYVTSILNDDSAWPGQQNRLELFAIRAMWEQVKERCAILVPPNVLFSTGQEQRFREHLVLEINAVEAVVSLPARQLMTTNLAAAVLVLNHQMDFSSIRFVDAGVSSGIEKEGRAGIRIKSSDMIMSFVRREKNDPIFVRDVEMEELSGSDISLYPPRYVSAFALPGEKVPLVDLVEAVIRPPAKPVGRDETYALEINISDLHQWGYVSQIEKQVAARQTKLQASRLRDDDLIFSIKGSLGKIGIFRMSEIAQITDETDVTYVVSQSCIALRLSPAGRKIISPIALYMYLRSATGKAAMEALNVGAAIPHIQPRALLEQLEVPVLPLAQQTDLEETFQNLMVLQQDIREKQKKLEAMTATYWKNPEN